MKKFNSKTFKKISGFTLLLITVSCSNSDFLIDYYNQDPSIIDFEEKMISNNIDGELLKTSETHLLVGFTTIRFTEEEQLTTRRLFAEYEDSISKSKGIFVSEDGSYARIYYPMRNAIIKYEGKFYVANDEGVITLPSNYDLNKILVFGRAQTTHSIYTTFNIKIMPYQKYEENNTLVFNLGEKYRTCNKKGITKKAKIISESVSGNQVSCVENHKPYYNCSYAYPSCVNTNSDCVTKSDRCMDYNGWGSDCSGSKAYFLGSDCSRALLRGYCWNEIMD